MADKKLRRYKGACCSAGGTLSDSTVKAINHQAEVTERPQALTNPTYLHKLANMTFKATVLYPNDEDATFNMEYYLSTHMPLVHDNWSQSGLQGWEVIKLSPGLDGSKPQYSVQATLIFNSADDFAKCAQSSSAAKIFGDIPNFSNKSPVIVGGDVIKASSY